MLMTYEVTRDWPTVPDRRSRRRWRRCVGRALLKRKVTLVPILRAGLGMTDGMLRVLPEARVGHLGVRRERRRRSSRSSITEATPAGYRETPRSCSIDPMLATGGSASGAITFLKAAGVTSLKFVCLVAAPEGIRAVHELHPDVQIYAAAVDRQLNEKGYILPGLGDAGDRIFGT